MGAYSDAVNALSPLAYWRLGETSGTVAVDETGLHDGTYFNTPTLGSDPLIPGETETSVLFDKASFEYMETGYIIDYAAFSITALIKVGNDFTTNMSVCHHGRNNASGNQGINLHVKTDKSLQVVIFDGAWKTITSAIDLIEANTVYQVCVTKNASNLVTLYLNDVKIDDLTINNLYLDNAKFTVGCGYNTDFYNFYSGNISKVGYFTTALTLEEISTLYDIIKHKAFDITIDHTKVDEDLYDFPLLVNLGATSGIDAFDSEVIFDTLIPLDNANDDFTGNDGDSPNSLLWVQNDVTTANTTIQGNKLRVSTFANHENSYTYGNYRILGDFDIQVDYSNYAIEGSSFNNQSTIYVQMYDDLDVYQGYVLCGRNDDSNYYVRSSLDGPTQTSTGGDLTGKFRITRVGTTIKCYYWSGAEWVWNGSPAGWTATFQHAGKVRFNIRSVFYLTEDTTCDYDNLTITSDDLVWLEDTVSVKTINAIYINPADGQPPISPDDITMYSRQCKVEIDRWDQVNKQAQLWVKVPYISKDVDTVISLSYDTNNPDNSENIGYIGEVPAQAVWSDYDAVYHMSDASGKDSTANEYDGTVNLITDADIVDLGIGKGLNFNAGGVVNRRIQLPEMLHGDLGELSIEISAKSELLVTGGGGRAFSMNASAPGTSIHVNNRVDDGVRMIVAAGQDVETGSGHGTDSLHDYMLSSVELGTLTAFKDDGQLGTDGTTQGYELEGGYSTYINMIGALPSTSTTSDRFEGWLKEFRLSKKTRSAGYNKTNYNSKNDLLTRYSNNDPIVLLKLITGTIAETVAVVDWMIRAYRLDTGVLTAQLQAIAGAFTLEVPPAHITPSLVTVSPIQGIPWRAVTAQLIDDLVFPTDPETTPYYYKCTVSGTGVDGVTGSVEPTWPTGVGNTVVDGTVTWEVVERMIQPITHSPMIPK